MPTRELTITLSPEVAAFVEHKVRSGAYASADEMVREGLQTLQDQDAGQENWLREHVLPGHAEYLENPSAAVAAEHILERIKARRAAAGQ